MPSIKQIFVGIAMIMSVVSARIFQIKNSCDHIVSLGCVDVNVNYDYEDPTFGAYNISCDPMKLLYPGDELTLNGVELIADIFAIKHNISTNDLEYIDTLGNILPGADNVNLLCYELDEAQEIDEDQIKVYATDGEIKIINLCDN